MIKFPFPIHVAELNDLGQEMAQALEKDLAEADWRQKRQARHTLAYVLNPANQVTTGLLEKQLAFAKRAGKAVDDKLAFMGTVVSHLANIERLYQQRLFARTIATTHLHTRSGTPANNTNTESEVIMVSRKDNKARYLVKYRDREEIYSNYHYLFSDGVMLPVDKWNNDCTTSYWVKVGEVVDGGFVFANAALEQEFQQSPTVDDYFNEQRAFDSLDKLFLFFGGAYGELEWYGANFANQATLDKFMALFPEI
ncbi:hypothetical protein, partial [Conchiformibius steedae]|uniref:hypothetical protein n=1 Tax=Conchiformibius steedae TaxID=153493 RepID=UPI0026E9F2DD